MSGGWNTGFIGGGSGGGGAVAAITAVAAANSNADALLNSTTYADAATVLSVSLVTGTSAIITLSAVMYSAGSSGNHYTSFAVTGATTIAASDASSVDVSIAVGTFDYAMSRTMLVTGLTPGTNVFTVKHRSSVVISDTWHNRSIAVLAL